jgi:phosphocarrier protein HPr
VVQREVLIKNPTGLHARPASLLVAMAAKSKSKTTILFNNKTINAKSMLSLLGGGIRTGSQIVIVTEGEDEQETLVALCELIEQFDE